MQLLTTPRSRYRPSCHCTSFGGMFIYCFVLVPFPAFRTMAAGNGDIMSYEDGLAHLERGIDGLMIARGALMKPWIFTEIKERRYAMPSRSDTLSSFSIGSTRISSRCNLYYSNESVHVVADFEGNK